MHVQQSKYSIHIFNKIQSIYPAHLSIQQASKKTSAKSKKTLKVTKKSAGNTDMLEDLSQGGYGFDGGDDMDFM